ncbi:MAG TPA: GNAT family N-acetyltransferase [Actinopolymorphaceae bacterium]|jgi:RimJ/RimL family protein N-acetyltransferase
MNSRRAEPGDLALLALELETLWASDDRGRLCGSVRPWPQLAIAVGSDGRRVAVGSDVPDHFADELSAAAQARPWDEPAGDPPRGLGECIRLLTTMGAVTVTSGPSFVVPPGTASTVEPVPRRSSGTDDDLIPLRPADWWEPDEWCDLLAGELGPWAMSMEAGQVTALCHTSRLSERAAEAGVWAHPNFRGHGRASAATAVWAGHPDLGDRVRFYSTSSDNGASRRVAAKLGLRPIGWIWKLSVERDPWNEIGETGSGTRALADR